MGERIAVLGGEGSMGNVVVAKAREQGHEVWIIDPKSQLQIPPEEAIAWATVIYASMFPKNLKPWLDAYKEHIRPDQIFVENSTVKKTIIPSLIALDQRGTSVQSTHPLSRHNQPWRGQKVLRMDVGKNPERARNFTGKLYGAYGAYLIDTGLETHDQVMLKEQLIPHFVMRSIGNALSELGVDMKEFWNMAPANSELFQLGLWRTLIQDPKISATIITNFLEDEEGRKIIETVIRSMSELLLISKDEEAVKTLLQKTYQHLNTNGLGQEMEERTTIIVERIGNLRLHSITINAKEDKPGVMSAISAILAEAGLNLTAFDSHVQEPGVKFLVGQDNQNDSPDLKQAIERLESEGFKVEIRNP